MTDYNNIRNEKFIDAWKNAEKDLSISIEIPYFLTNENGQIIKYKLLVKHFGSKVGTLVFSITDTAGFETAKKYGYYCSALNFEEYSNYNRNLFIDTLNDWSYFGDELNKPNWYDGKPWTQ